MMNWEFTEPSDVPISAKNFPATIGGEKGRGDTFLHLQGHTLQELKGYGMTI